MLASFKVLEASDSIATLFLAFASFSLVSSSVYISNDLLDLESDRAHSIKRNRPLASGKIPVAQGIAVGSVLLISGLLIGFIVGMGYFSVLMIYLALAFVYSIWLKAIALVDVISLAGLYTLRVVAGGLASSIEISYWLLAFSVFFFLSLAWLKRYAELESIRKIDGIKAVGRGYSVTDMPLILVFGAASAFITVVIFALYLDSNSIREQYAVPEIGWLAIPFLLYLIGRMWFKAHRGEMNQDPVIFLLRDWPSLVTVVLIAAALLLAHIGFTL